MVTGNPTEDFKAQNPTLLSTVLDFKLLYDDLAEKQASKILWAAYFVAVPSADKNPFKNAKDDAERRKLLKQEYCPAYDEQYFYLEKSFKNLCLSKAHTLYNIHLRKYEEFTASISDMDLTEEEQMDRYATLMGKFEKIIKVFDMLEKRYSEERKTTSKIEGGGTVSVGEKRRNR